MTIRIAGLDGCRAGWLMFSLSTGKQGIEPTEWQLLRSDSELRIALESHYRIFVDMPIGLPNRESGRDCDRELRKALGRAFSSSVFSPPCREALKASDYITASMVNAAYTGKKLSIQSWNLFPKIRQLDGLLQEDPSLRERLFESHPEWLFMIAKDGELPGPLMDIDQSRGEEIASKSEGPSHGPLTALKFKKKTSEGIEERLAMLSLHLEASHDNYQHALDLFTRAEVARDDIVDAMILAVMAAKSVKRNAGGVMREQEQKAGLPNGSLEGLQTFPELGSDRSRPKVQRDGTGLPKAIWYPSSV